MPRGDFPTPPSILVIACGALAREIVDLKRANGWPHMTVQCLPAELHNYPSKIPDAVRGKIREMRADYDRVFVAYADCGTGGMLDRVLEEEGVERIPGAHCYQFLCRHEPLRVSRRCRARDFLSHRLSRPGISIA